MSNLEGMDTPDTLAGYVQAVSGPSLDEIAARIPAHVAQLAVAKAFAQVGSEREWDAGTIERVMGHLDAALPYLGWEDVHSPYQMTPQAVGFWSARLGDDR